MGVGLLLEMAASGQGERIALGPLDGGTSYTRLAELAAGGGAVLTAVGAKQAVLLGRNGPILPHVLFAAAHAGIPFCPMNYRLSTQYLHDLLAELDGRS
jgi:acyl-CoA synthetase (AMP-forming)/AMP-acid ligase II